MGQRKTELAREVERYKRMHPRSAAQAEESKQHLLTGNGLNWWRMWADDASVHRISPVVPMVSVAMIGSLLALLTLVLANSGYWSFMEQLGGDRSLSAEFISTALAVTAFAGWIGASTVCVQADRFGHPKPVAVGSVLSSLAILALVGLPPGAALFLLIPVFLYAGSKKAREESSG